MSAKRGHEPNVVDYRFVLGFGLVLLVATGLLVLLAQVVLDYLAASRPRRVPPPAAVAPAVLPPEPRLQVSPAEDLRSLREREEAILKSYGWVDRDAGIARIPIERALSLAAERGLPVFPPVADAPAGAPAPGGDRRGQDRGRREPSP